MKSMSEKTPPQEPSAGDGTAPARTLKELLGLAANPRSSDLPQEDAGIAEVLRRACLFDEAHAAVDLHAKAGDLAADVGGPGLGQRD